MNTKPSNSKSMRIESLDSFRGIASLLIMLTHFILYVPEIFQVENLSWIYDWLKWKLPYFFILSGFVLTLSYSRNRERGGHSYLRFLVNRALRIYPLFMLTTILIFITKVAFCAGADIDGASRYFNISWRIAPTFGDLLHALTLVGLADSWAFNGPAWTLIFEMRYALLFPLFYFALRKSWIAILGFIALSYVTYSIDSQIERVDIFYATQYQLSNLCSMIEFLVFYLAGMVLALNRERIFGLYRSLSSAGAAATVAVAVLFMLAPRWVPHIVPTEAKSFANNLVIMVGVVMWVVILINNRIISKLFTNKVLTALGRSSFSIYMWHTPIFIFFYMMLHEKVDIWWIITLCVPVTLIVARLSFRYIEQPCISLSHRLTQRENCPARAAAGCSPRS